MKIQFNYKGNKYFILSWSKECNLITIKKESGSIARDIKYPDKMTVKEFLEKLEKINFM